MKKSEFSNPITVGDIVEFTLIDDTERGVISKIIERKIMLSESPLICLINHKF